MRRSDAIAALAAALAKAQGEMEAAKREHTAKVVSKKGEGSSYSYNYADLANVLEACRGPLTKNGLSVVQEATAEGAVVRVTTLLLHESGEWIEFDPLVLMAADAGPQSVGSGITYARRYAWTAAIGVAFESDDDGNSAQGNSAETTRRAPLPECPACKSSKGVIVGKPEFGGGFVCYKAKGGCGHKWQAEEKPAEKPPEQGKKPASSEYEALRKALIELGVPEGNREMAEAVMRWAVPTASVKACHSDPAVAKKVHDEIIAKATVGGLSSEQILAEATGTVAA